MKITATAICGSDLHLLDGYQPTMKSGDILGHEPMGIVEEVGSAVKTLKKGDRAVVRLALAERAGFRRRHVKERLDEMTDGRGPDRRIDAVGTEAHSHGSIGAGATPGRARRAAAFDCTTPA